MKKGNMFLTCILFCGWLIFAMLEGCSCDENGGEGDGDIEDEGTAEVDVSDIRPEEISVDEGPGDEMVEEQEEDLPVDEITQEEIPSGCVGASLSCDSSLTNETNTGLPNNMTDYNCIGYSVTGGEKVYSFTNAEDRMVTIDISIFSSDVDLDILILTGECDPDTCIAAGTSGGSTDSVTFRAEGGSTYYVVVDGYDGGAGNFNISVTCALPENCTNQIDDNGNSLIDCSDPECNGATECTETTCDNSADDDHDGMADCHDRDCAEAANCYESSCNDGADNDNDTDMDCADIDCFGNSACATGSAAIGDPCVLNSDCQSGGCWNELTSGWPGGYCLTLGYTDCTGTCPSGSTCVDFSGWGLGPWGCLDNCDSGQCRTGYECYSGLNICIPGCTANDQCTVSNNCNTGSGICYPVPEDCSNTNDDDGDNAADCLDYDCMFTSTCASSTSLAGGDTCTGAIALPVPSGERGQVIVTGTTSGMGNDLILDCAFGDSNDVVYSFQITNPAFIIVDVVGGFQPPMSNDTSVSIRSNCASGPDLLCNDDMETYYHSQIYGSLSAGTYYIIIDGYDETSPGDFYLSVKFQDLP